MRTWKDLKADIEKMSLGEEITLNFNTDYVDVLLQYADETNTDYIESFRGKEIVCVKTKNGLEIIKTIEL